MIEYNNLPNESGCYLFKDQSKVIYVGKAKNLKKRIASYFQKNNLDEKTSLLVKNIKKIDFIVTDNEVEALLLENTLIKKYKPKYNINLKDSQKYAFLRITTESFPRLLLSRSKEESGKHFGPFVSGFDRAKVSTLLNKTFKLRTCKRFPKRACIRWHIGLCDAPCIKKISEKDYLQNVKNVELVLKGKTKSLVKKLETEMEKFSEKLMFEQSIVIRDQINAIKILKEKQNVERKRQFNEDIINFTIQNGKVYLLIFNVYKGTLNNKQEFVFDYSHEFFDEFLTQFYLKNPIPKEIIIPKKVDSIVKQVLEKIGKKKVRLIVPKKGEKKKLLELIKKNIDYLFFGNIKKLEELKEELMLNELPLVIECFDISHLSGTNTVGSMVQFRNGKSDKSNYRRFKIKHNVGIDDFKSIAEIVRRHYFRLKNEGTEFPNLIVIDGGKGQLYSALDELKKLNLKIPIISLAKREEEVFVPGLNNPLKIDKKKSALKLLQQIRDEAHRFAITYNRLLRKKELTK